MVDNFVKSFHIIRNRIAPLKFPILNWISTYGKDDFSNDLLAGVVVFILLVPTGMACAILAGMPPIYGLYTSIFPPFVYAIFATSSQLSMGPNTIIPLLLYDLVTKSFPSVTVGSDEYVKIIMDMTMIVGLIMIVLGFLKLGDLSVFLNDNVLTGFITASALVISLAQMKYITGINVPQDNAYTYQVIYYLLSNINQLSPYPLMIAIFNILFLYKRQQWKKKLKKKPPNMDINIYRCIQFCLNGSFLVVVFIGGIMAYLFISNGIDISVVGVVPAGILPPGFKFSISFQSILSFLPSCFTFAIISYAGNWAVAKKFPAIEHCELDPTQELIAYGFSNIIGIFFYSFNASAGLARSAVNAENGAKTPLAGCISAIFMLITLLCATSTFYYIPKATLAAVVLISIYPMINFTEFYRVYKLDQEEGIVIIITFLITFFIGSFQGVFSGIMISIMIILRNSAYPDIINLGRLSSANSYCFVDIKEYEKAIQYPKIAILRMDGLPFYANSLYLKDAIIEAVTGKYHSNKDISIQLVIIDTSPWSYLDTTIMKVLSDIHNEFILKDITLAFVTNKMKIMNQLKKGMNDKIGFSNFYTSIDDAIDALNSKELHDNFVVNIMHDNEHNNLLGNLKNHIIFDNIQYSMIEKVDCPKCQLPQDICECVAITDDRILNNTIEESNENHLYDNELSNNV